MINRQKLIEELEESIKWIEDYCEINEYHNGIVSGLKRAINHVTAEPPADQWIPCSERLPEEDGSYLCTYGKYHMGVYRFSNDLYSIDDYDFTDYKGVRGFYVYDSEWGYSEVDYITAWTELPKAYKGVE